MPCTAVAHFFASTYLTFRSEYPAFDGTFGNIHAERAIQHDYYFNRTHESNGSWKGLINRCRSLRSGIVYRLNVSAARSWSNVTFTSDQNMTILNNISNEDSKALAKCYTQHHPDAQGWLPGAEDSPHYSVWARFDVHDIYYVGGFGE